jgi:hypothetical protein
MQTNISKTFITGFNLDLATKAIPEGFRVSHVGLKTVGGWAGTDIAKNEFNEKMVDKWIPPFESYKLPSPSAIMRF